MELPLHGVMAETKEADEILAATKAAYAAGYRRMDAYSPLPVHGLAEALGFKSSILPAIVLTGGILGCIGGFALQYWASVVIYPIIIGGHPMNIWPWLCPGTFEWKKLISSFSAVLLML